MKHEVIWEKESNQRISTKLPYTRDQLVSIGAAKESVYLSILKLILPLHPLHEERNRELQFLISLYSSGIKNSKEKSLLEVAKSCNMSIEDVKRKLFLFSSIGQDIIRLRPKRIFYQISFNKKFRLLLNIFLDLNEEERKYVTEKCLQALTAKFNAFFRYKCLIRYNEIFNLGLTRIFELIAPNDEYSYANLSQKISELEANQLTEIIYTLSQSPFIVRERDDAKTMCKTINNLQRRLEDSNDYNEERLLLEGRYHSTTDFLEFLNNFGSVINQSFAEKDGNFYAFPMWHVQFLSILVGSSPYKLFNMLTEEDRRKLPKLKRRFRFGRSLVTDWRTVVKNFGENFPTSTYLNNRVETFYPPYTKNESYWLACALRGWIDRNIFRDFESSVNYLRRNTITRQIPATLQDYHPIKFVVSDIVKETTSQFEKVEVIDITDPNLDPEKKKLLYSETFATPFVSNKGAWDEATVRFDIRINIADKIIFLRSKEERKGIARRVAFLPGQFFAMKYQLTNGTLKPRSDLAGILVFLGGRLLKKGMSPLKRLRRVQLSGADVIVVPLKRNDYMWKLSQQILKNKISGVLNG